MKRRVPAILAASALALGAVQATAPAASAKAAGEDSLAALLTSDGNTFDKNKNDFDIVTEAALAVVGAKPDSPVALLADGAKLTTAQGGKITVKVKTKPSVSVTLKDRDKNAQDPKAILKALDLNKGNKQVAHGIDRVLRPIDL